MQEASTITTARAKPRLVIFDDDSILLERFTAQYRKGGYEVIPVLVAVGTNDSLFEGGFIKQGSCEVPQNDPVHSDPVRTVASELAEAMRLAGNDVNPKPRRANLVKLYTAMQGFERGVKTQDEIRALLEELKPDCVLSDNQMRHPIDVGKDGAIMGGDVMRIASEVLPDAPRVIHTSLYSFFDDQSYQDFTENPGNMEMYEEDMQAARDGGYGLLGKQSFAEDADPRIDAYFRQGMDGGFSTRLCLDPLQRQ